MIRRNRTYRWHLTALHEHVGQTDKQAPDYNRRPLLRERLRGWFSLMHPVILIMQVNVPLPDFKRFTLALGVSLLLGGIVSPALGQNGEEAVLRGFVTDRSNGTPLPQATVVLRDSTGIVEASVTDGDGFYQIVDIPPDWYRLAVSYLGFKTHRDTLHLRPESRTLSVALHPTQQTLDEITVEARREVEDAQAGLEHVRAADIETLPSPGPGADLGTYLRSLPSVAATGDRGGRFFVRGGTSSQNLILVDGTPVKKPFHIVGFYSAFPADLVSSADFYAGGFSARYLGRTSSVLDVTLRPGNLKQYQGRVEMGPLISGVQVEGPIDRGEKSFLVNFRHSLIEWTGPDLLGQSTPYRFYDLMTRYYTQGETSQCSFTGLRTYDRGRVDPSRASSFRWSNTSVGGECLTFGGESSQQVYVSFGTTHYTNTVQTPDGDNRSSGTWDTHLTLDLTNPYSWGELRGGFRMQSKQFQHNLGGTFLGIRAENTFELKGGGYLGAKWRPGDALTLSPSVGMQLPFSWGTTTIEPRLRMAWQPGGTEQTRITAAGGVYQQLVGGVNDERDAGSTFRAWLPTPGGQALRSTHAILGVDHQLTSNLRGSVEGYYKTLRNIPVSEWTTLAIFNTDLALADGRAYGGHVSLKYRTDALNLRASYGVGAVEYRAPRNVLNAWVNTTSIQYTPPHDQRHKVTLIASADLNVLTASARWQYNSGRPFTRAYGTDNFLEIRGLRGLPRSERGNNRLLYNRPYNARLPAYHRLDVSLERDFTLSPHLNLTVEGGAINAYDRRNLFYLDLLTRERVDQLPVIPYVGLTLDIR